MLSQRSLFRKPPVLAGISLAVAAAVAAIAGLAGTETRAAPSSAPPPTEVQVQSVAPENVRVW